VQQRMVDKASSRKMPSCLPRRRTALSTPILCGSISISRPASGPSWGGRSSAARAVSASIIVMIRKDVFGPDEDFAVKVRDGVNGNFWARGACSGEERNLFTRDFDECGWRGHFGTRPSRLPQLRGRPHRTDPADLSAPRSRGGGTPGSPPPRGRVRSERPTYPTSRACRSSCDSPDNRVLIVCAYVPRRFSAPTNASTRSCPVSSTPSMFHPPVRIISPGPQAERSHVASRNSQPHVASGRAGNDHVIHRANDADCCCRYVSLRDIDQLPATLEWA
jgi:hypothetical protein